MTVSYTPLEIAIWSKGKRLWKSICRENKKINEICPTCMDSLAREISLTIDIFFGNTNETPKRETQRTDGQSQTRTDGNIV